MPPVVSHRTYNHLSSRKWVSVMRKWIIGLMLPLLPIWIVGCAAPTSSPPSSEAPLREVEQLKGDSGAYWLFKENVDGDTRYGIMKVSGEEVVPPRYSTYSLLRNDRLVVGEEQSTHFTVIDEQGNTVLELRPPCLETYCNWEFDTFDKTTTPYMAILEPKKDSAALFDIDGKMHGDTWRRMKFDTAETVLAENDDGLFSLDLEGQIIRQLGEVQTVAALFDNTRLLTKRQTFDGDLYGARDGDGRLLLEENFGTVCFLSRDRLVGQSPTLDKENPGSYTSIVDGTGQVICERYTYIDLPPADDTAPSYPYAYLIAAIATEQNAKVETGWYLIDHDGNPVNEEPFADYRTDSENPAILTFCRADDSTVTYSLETGKIVE